MQSEQTQTNVQAYIVPSGVAAAFANGGLSSVGRNFIYGEINAGRLKARKMGKRTIVLHKDLMLYLQGLPEYGDPMTDPVLTPIELKEVV